MGVPQGFVLGLLEFHNIKKYIYFDIYEILLTKYIENKLFWESAETIMSFIFKKLFTRITAIICNLIISLSWNV